MVEIESIADDEFIPDRKAHPASFYGADPLSFFVEKDTDGHAAGSQFFGVRPGPMQGEAGIKNIIDEQDIPSAKIPSAMMKTADFSRRSGTLIT